MSVYSHLLALGYFTTTQASIYTSPAGITTVVRDIDLYAFGGFPNDMYIAVSVSGSVATLFYVEATSSKQTYQWTGRAVLPPGGQLLELASNTAAQYIISGYQLG